MNDISSVLIDNSFCIRLLKKDAEYHKNAVEYFEYLLEKEIEIFLSTIVVSEYAVGDNPDNLLSLNAFKLLEFDYLDGKTAGEFYAVLKDDKELRNSFQRKVIINDIKLFAQIHHREIDGFLTTDQDSLKMIDRLRKSHQLKITFLNFSIPLNERLGKLF